MNLRLLGYVKQLSRLAQLIGLQSQQIEFPYFAKLYHALLVAFKSFVHGLHDFLSVFADTVPFECVDAILFALSPSSILEVRTMQVSIQNLQCLKEGTFDQKTTEVDVLLLNWSESNENMVPADAIRLPAVKTE